MRKFQDDKKTLIEVFTASADTVNEGSQDENRRNTFWNKWSECGQPGALGCGDLRRDGGETREQFQCRYDADQRLGDLERRSDAGQPSGECERCADGEGGQRSAVTGSRDLSGGCWQGSRQGNRLDAAEAVDGPLGAVSTPLQSYKKRNETCVRDLPLRTELVSTEAVRVEAPNADDLIDATWAALIAGRPKELHALESLLQRPLAATSSVERASLQRLEMLLAATARNLRILRGQVRMG